MKSQTPVYPNKTPVSPTATPETTTVSENGGNTPVPTPETGKSGTTVDRGQMSKAIEKILNKSKETYIKELTKKAQNE